MSYDTPRIVKHEQHDEQLQTRAEVKRLASLTIFIVVVTVLAVLIAVAVHAQEGGSASADDKYLLKSRAELRSPTSGDTKTGLSPLPPARTKYSR